MEAICNCCHLLKSFFLLVKSRSSSHTPLCSLIRRTGQQNLAKHKEGTCKEMEEEIYSNFYEKVEAKITTGETTESVGE